MNIRFIPVFKLEQIPVDTKVYFGNKDKQQMSVGKVIDSSNPSLITIEMEDKKIVRMPMALLLVEDTKKQDVKSQS